MGVVVAESVQAQAFTIDSLSTQERSQAVLMSRSISSAVVKGILHRFDPKTFLVDGHPGEMETQAAVAAQQIHPAVFAKMQPRVAALSTDGDRIKRVTGLTISELRKAGSVKPAAPKSSGLVGLALPPKAAAAKPKYNRLDLNLRAVQCMDETNPEGGGDDMVIGAMRVGASGNVGYTKAIVAGVFDDGTRINYGELPFGTVSLHTTSTWPKTFYWIFQLVESDSDDQEVADGITSLCSIVASTVTTLFLGSAAGEMAGAIVDAIGDLVGIFIDDDYFPLKGVCIKLNSLNDYGAAGFKDEHTGDIKGHGGNYRIGYRLRLV